MTDGETRYIAQVRVTVHRQTIENGYSLDDWDDRKAADIETERVFQDRRQINGGALADVFPVVDAAVMDNRAGDADD